MAASKDSTLVVVGSGPGIGSTTASLFAQKGFTKVALISRDADRLKKESKAVEEAAQQAHVSISVSTWPVDITDTTAYEEVLDKVASLGTLGCLFYNAARVQQSAFFKESVEDIEYDFKINNIALYVTARWAIPRLQQLSKSDPSASPSFLVTNSLLYKDPSPYHFSLSLAKSAQRSLVQSLVNAYQKDGIHIAVISVGGQVSPQAKTLNPKTIAERIWGLYTQSKTNWTWDLEILEE